MSRGTKLCALSLFFVVRKPQHLPFSETKDRLGIFEAAPNQDRGSRFCAAHNHPAPRRQWVSADPCHRVYCPPPGSEGEGNKMEPPTICMPSGIQSVYPFLKQAAACLFIYCWTIRDIFNQIPRLTFQQATQRFNGFP